MKRRQTSTPTQWLVADERLGAELWHAVRKLPPASGILFLHGDMAKGKRARLKSKLVRMAASRRLTIADELAGEAARVHNLREIRSAGLKRTPLLFLSPLFPTRSHPDWLPMPRMRAAALLRLANVPIIALGGMNSRRFARIRRLGFQAWAGIDAFKT